MSMVRTSWIKLAACALAAAGGCGDEAKSYRPGTGTGAHVTQGDPLTGTAGSAPLAQATTGLPCDVQRIVESRCGLCHGATPTYGAPFALVTRADFQAIGGDGGAVHTRAMARIHDANMPMPPPGQPGLDDGELATLSAWLAAGAPASGAVCSSPMEAEATAQPGDDPQRPADVDECRTFLSYSESDPGAPFAVETGEIYTNFTFENPWAQQDVQAVTLRHVVPPEAEPVVHHTLLYQSEGSLPIGVTASVAQHGNDVLLAGWVPGGSDTEMPPDVGLKLSRGDFTIEIHHFNNTGQRQQSATGIEICVTHSRRPHEAAVHWIGQELQLGLPAIQWEGTCTPDYGGGPVTILTSWPHMHLEGRHMRTVINRAGGQRDALVDEDFDFYFQRTYATPAVLQPGDTLTTTCDYAQPMSFGTSSSQEMCYNFVVAYPAGALAGAGLASSVNHCLR